MFNIVWILNNIATLLYKLHPKLDDEIKNIINERVCVTFNYIFYLLTTLIYFTILYLYFKSTLKISNIMNDKYISKKKTIHGELLNINNLLILV